MVHTNHDAIWELTCGMFQKPIIVHKEQFKSAPCFDSSPITGMMKCVTDSMLFPPAIAKAPVPNVSRKYNRPLAKLPCAVTRVNAEGRSTPIQAMNNLHLVLASEECDDFRCGGDWAFVSDGEAFISDGGWDHNPAVGRCSRLSPLIMWTAGVPSLKAVLKEPVFFLFRTALKDRPKGPPTANSHQPPTSTHQTPPTAANR